MIRFSNARILTLAPVPTSSGMGVDTNIISGELWVDEDKISYIGPARQDMPAFERTINCRENLLMPSFKNAHAHTAMTFLRSYIDDVPLQAWLFDNVFPMEAKITDELIYEFTRLGILEYLSSGITASFDMYYRRAPYVSANLDCGFRTTICGGSAAYAIISKEYDLYNNAGPLIRYIPGIHAEYTVSQEELEAVQALCKEKKAPCFAHNAETRHEVEECRARRGGLTPTQFMESLGLFDYGGGGFHCIWFDEQDQEIFARRGLWAVTCPGSNAKLASGIAPLQTYLDKGIHLAIGTDGAASNNALDMFREMYLACVLQKLRTEDAAACPAERVLEMACRGSALAMGLENCDCLAPGKQADLILIDLRKPNMQPTHSIVKNLVYSGSKENIALTMVAGRILYEGGLFHVGEEPHRIYQACEDILRRIQAK